MIFDFVDSMLAMSPQISQLAIFYEELDPMILNAFLLQENCSLPVLVSSVVHQLKTSLISLASSLDSGSDVLGFGFDALDFDSDALDFCSDALGFDHDEAIYDCKTAIFSSYAQGNGFLTFLIFASFEENEMEFSFVLISFDRENEKLNDFFVFFCF